MGQPLLASLVPGLRTLAHSTSLLVLDMAWSTTLPASPPERARAATSSRPSTPWLHIGTRFYSCSYKEITKTKASASLEALLVYTHGCSWPLLRVDGAPRPLLR